MNRAGRFELVAQISYIFVRRQNYCCWLNLSLRSWLLSDSSQHAKLPDPLPYRHRQSACSFSMQIIAWSYRKTARPSNPTHPMLPSLKSIATVKRESHRLRDRVGNFAQPRSYFYTSAVHWTSSLVSLFPYLGSDPPCLLLRMQVHITFTLGGGS